MKLTLENTHFILNNDPMPIIGHCKAMTLCYFNKSAALKYKLVQKDLGTPLSNFDCDLKGHVQKIELDNEITILKYPSFEKSSGEAMKIHHNNLEMLSELAAGLAHEINNPLGIISLSISIVEDQAMKSKEALGDGLDKIMSYIDNVDNAIERTKEIIQKLVLFSKNEDQDNIREITVENFIRNALIFCKNRIKNLQIQVEEDFVRDYKLKTKVGPLMQAYVSILFNALESFEETDHESAKIILAGHHDEKFSYLEIKNNGPKINEEDFPIIMCAFHSSKNSKHLGNGLAVANELIVGLGGQIKITSTDQETCFTLMIPNS